MGQILAFTKASSPSARERDALDGLVKQYGQMFGKNSQSRMDLFMRSYNVSDRSDIARRLSQIYKNLMEQIEGRLKLVPVGKISTAIAYPHGTFENLSRDDFARIETFGEGFKLTNYPDIHIWDEIQTHPSFLRYSPEDQSEMKEIFFAWEGIVKNSVAELHVFASWVSAIGYTMETVVKEGKTSYLNALVQGPHGTSPVSLFPIKPPFA